MSDTRVSVLTPPGTGAIATVAVTGPGAWDAARRLFRPAGKTPLPDTPELHRFWFGSLGEGVGDEVILVVTGLASPPHPEHPAERGVPTSPRRGEVDTWAHPTAAEGRQEYTSPRRGEVAVLRTAGEGVALEIHCHGGRRVVRWVVEQFVRQGCVEGEPGGNRPRVLDLLARAPTLRAASVLLDQYHGAFDAAVRSVLTHLEEGRTEAAARELDALAAFAPVGRHLVEPWKVVIAGPPNVGKSSLVNALAGYQRAVVSDVAGTTRDVVTVPVAFDGWPVELADTAGLREAAGLEAEGVDRAKRLLAEADLVVWVMDATSGEPGDVSPPEVSRRDTRELSEGPGRDPARPASSGGLTSPGSPKTELRSPGSPGGLVVINKVDQPPGWDLSRFPDALRVSALTREGVPGLAAAIARTLVPNPPPPGAAVPFSPQLAKLVEAANAALSGGCTADAAHLLRDAIGHT